MTVSQGAAQIADKLKSQIIQWQYARGELAEVLKAEASARAEGIDYSDATTITARRLAGDRNAIEWTKESIDLKAKVDIHEKWIWFYGLLLTEGITIPVSDCP